MICEKNNVVLTIDGDQNNYKGTIKIHNGSAEANTGKVNIKNVNVSLKNEGKNLKMQNVTNVTINGQKYDNVGSEAQELNF